MQFWRAKLHDEARELKEPFPPSEVNAPRVAFIGFCDRAKETTEGHPLFWGHNLLKLSKSRVYPFFPISMRGQSFAFAVFRPRAGESIKLVFRGTEGQAAFDVGMNLGILAANADQQGQRVLENSLTPDTVADPGWFFAVGEMPSEVIVFEPGIYNVLTSNGSGEVQIAQVALQQIVIPPFSSEDIAALRSDPLGMKHVRLSLGCPLCHHEFRTYAGVEQLEALENEGWQWSQDIKEVQFRCSCGKVSFALSFIKSGFHGLLRRDLFSNSGSTFSATPLYEKSALEEAVRGLQKLVDDDDGLEEPVQRFLTKNPIFFHTFAPIKIFTKPHVLNDYVADFAILNNRGELILIEIERPNLALVKNDGGIAAPLQHAFDQVRTWKLVADDHRAAFLASLDLSLKEVSNIRGAVVAGRSPDDPKKLRMLRAASGAGIEVQTFDDLIGALADLVGRIAAL